MKTISVWLGLVSLLVSFSCQTSSDLEFAAASNFEGKHSQGEASAYERTGDEIQKIALDVATVLRSSDGLRSSKPLSVASMFALPNESDLRNTSASNANLKVVEFSDNEGYAIVSENTAGTEVLYVADNGRFDKAFYSETLERHIHGYMIMYTCPTCGFVGTCTFGKCNIPHLPLEVVCPYKCRSIRECIHNPRRDSLMRELSNIQIGFERNENCKMLRGKENLLKTNWPLWAPLNDLADEVEVIDQNGNPVKVPAYIGCNAVAIMQMIAYHMYPEKLGDRTIPWKRFREMDDFEGEDRKLIAYAARYVADQIKSIYGYEKGSRETSAYNTEVKKFMLNIGYKNYINQPYDIDIVKNELDENRPMFITASRKGAAAGHIWILDGYKEMQYTRQSDTIIYNFVHCNWGWGKKSNQGYCLSNVFYSEQQYQNLEYFEPKVNPIPHKKAYTERCTIYTGIEPQGFQRVYLPK